MSRSFLVLLVFSIAMTGLPAQASADGLIRTLPPDGTWVCFDVKTTIVHEDGRRTHSEGTLTVRSVGRSKINGKQYRWLEFEHSWEQPPSTEVPRKFHSSIQKVAFDESVFMTNTTPTTGILTGFASKTSADKRPDEWKYNPFHILKPGLGSKSGLGLLVYYTRAPFDRTTNIGSKKIPVLGESLDCTGIEQSETNHKLGVSRQEVRTAAYRQWSNDSAPFGVVDYHFEILRMDGISFEQKLNLKSTGNNAVTSLPNAK